jgi:hypothetical protein
MKNQELRQKLRARIREHQKVRCGKLPPNMPNPEDFPESMRSKIDDIRDIAEILGPITSHSKRSKPPASSASTPPKPNLPINPATVFKQLTIDNDRTGNSPNIPFFMPKIELPTSQQLANNTPSKKPKNHTLSSSSTTLNERVPFNREAIDSLFHNLVKKDV